jgi:hypothetical protein
VEGIGIQIARAFIEQIGDQIADAGLVGRVLGRAAAKGISGTVESCTNQASIPPGEIRCWIFAAASEGVEASGSIARRATIKKAMRRAPTS